jgi:hypothetical protein
MAVTPAFCAIPAVAWVLKKTVTNGETGGGRAIRTRGTAPDAAVTAYECSLVLLARELACRAGERRRGKELEPALASVWKDVPFQPCTVRTECDLLA